MENVPTCPQIELVISFYVLLMRKVREGDEKKLGLRWGVEVQDDSITQQDEAMKIQEQYDVFY